MAVSVQCSGWAIGNSVPSDGKVAKKSTSNGAWCMGHDESTYVCELHEKPCV